MKKLLVLGLAAALLAPAAATQAKPHHAGPAKRIKLIKKAHVPNRLVLRCHMPRVHPRREMLRLARAGFTRIRYQGRKVFRPRCAQFLYFSACKGALKYRVIVRYIRYTRYVITLRQGLCRGYLPRPHLRNPGS